MFRAHRAQHQERQIVSIQPLVTVTLCRWLCRDARSTKCKKIFIIACYYLQPLLLGQGMKAASFIINLYWTYLI